GSAHWVHADAPGRGRMGRDGDEVVLFGDDLDPEPHQRVLQPVDCLLVTGNDSRRKDYDIAGLQRDVGMVLAGDPGERCPWFPLAAGADHQDLIARYVSRLVFGQESRQICEIAVLTSGLVYPP